MPADTNTLTAPQKLAFEMRREMQRAISQLSLGLEMDDSPEALLAIVECCEQRLRTAAVNARDVLGMQQAGEDDDPDLPY